MNIKGVCPSCQHYWQDHKAIDWVAYCSQCACVYNVRSNKRIDGEILDADPTNHPAHYTSHPSGVECIQITEHMNFCLGNAIKYIWRAGLKDDNAIEDLQKSIWYLNREIARRTK